MLLGVLPEAQCATDMHIQGADNAELRNLNALIEESKVLLRNSLLFLSEEHNTFCREFVLVEHLRVGCLFKA